jgi:hypothetical protein
LEYIFTCARDVYSRTTLKKLNSSIKSIEAILIENPLLGAVEPLLIGREQEYRHIVIKPLFKIIYRIEDDIIYMIDIWDSRRNPKNLTEGLS